MVFVACAGYVVNYFLSGVRNLEYLWQPVNYNGLKYSKFRRSTLHPLYRRLLLGKKPLLLVIMPGMLTLRFC